MSLLYRLLTSGMVGASELIEFGLNPYLNVGGVAGRGGEIVSYESYDIGATWAKKADITTGAAKLHSFPFWVLNKSDIALIWNYGSGPGTDILCRFPSSPPDAQTLQLLDDDFEGQVVGAVPSDWSDISSAACSCLIDDTYVHGGTRSVKMIDGNNNGWAIIERAASEDNNIKELWWWFYCEAAAACLLYLYDNLTDDTIVLLAGFDDLGKVNAWDGVSKTEVGSYSTSTWYRLRVVIDLQAQTYDAYLQEEGEAEAQIVNDFDFYAAVTHAKGVRFQLGKTTETTCWIDDVRLQIPPIDTSAWDNVRVVASMQGYWASDVPAPMAFTSITKPVAHRHDGTNDRTYITYMGSDQGIYVTYFDHDTQLFALPVRIGVVTVNGAPGHGAPSILVDSSGYIYVFYNAHFTNMPFKKSTNPEDISAWGGVQTITETGEATYPAPIEVGTDIYLFYRERIDSFEGNLRYVKSADGGSNWDAAVNVADFGANEMLYSLVVKGGDGRVHACWSRYPQPSADPWPRFDVYYAYTVDFSTWYKRDGTPVALPINAGTADKVYDSGADWCQCRDLVTLDNEPYILYISNLKFRIALYNGSWASYDIVDGDDHWDGGALLQ